MYKVIDYSVVESRELTDFSRDGPDNRAVVTETLMTECLKRTGVENFQHSFVRLGDFADHVVVMRPFSELRRLRPREEGLQVAIVDSEKTRNFPGLCAAILRGEPAVIAQIIEQQRKNHEFVSRLRLYVDESLREALTLHQRLLSPVVGTRLRRGRPVDAEQRAIIRTLANQLTLEAYRSTFPRDALPEVPDRH